MEVGVVVEGQSDVAVVQKMLLSCDIATDPQRIFRCNGKNKLDRNLSNYNRAAMHSPFIVVRDTDNEENGCAAALRERKLPGSRQNPGLCFRLAVRSIEAWLLADAEAFAETFSVALAKVPVGVEELAKPEEALINLCRRSRSSHVRAGVVPPRDSTGRVGPEYVTYITKYARSSWRPQVAANSAPSLRRAIAEVKRLVEIGIWA